MGFQDAFLPASKDRSRFGSGSLVVCGSHAELETHTHSPTGSWMEGTEC